MIGTVEQCDSVCIVGAGPFGLIVARAMRRVGQPFVILEKHDDVGGIWDMGNEGTPMYESCHFVSSKNASSYFDYPMPANYPDYPSRQQVLEFIRGFADTFDLRRSIEFGAKVMRAEPDGDRWIVTTGDGHRRSFEGLIVCTGGNWHPRMPDFQGSLAGDLIHSLDYHTPKQIEDRNVLVVGLGNSGADIASDAVKTARRVFVSIRRGYHFVPKHLFGVPTLDLVANPALAPERVRGIDFAEAVALSVGDITRLGFPAPDHKVGETHPVLNTQLLYNVAHGRIIPKADVERLDGDQVRFVDGTAERIDYVICATGYRYRVPFIEEQSFGWQGEHPRFFLNAFVREHPTLFILGLYEANGSPWTLADQAAIVIGEYLQDRRNDAPRAAVLRGRVEREQIDLQEGAAFVKSERTVNYTHMPTYYRELDRLVDELSFTKIERGMYDELRAGSDLRADAYQRVAA